MGAELIDDDFLTARKLIAALESSAVGEAALDLRIGRRLGDSGRVRVGSADAALIGELRPETVEIIVGEMVTPYTRSLDAGIPGENIVFSMYSGAKGKWVSVHRNSAGHEFVAWAATEILSRRAAGLRGLAEIVAEGGEADVVRFVAAEDEDSGDRADRRSAGPAGMRTAAADQPAWKVSF